MATDNRELPSAPDGWKYMPCRYCDEPMIVGATRRKLPHHADCAIRASSAAMHQMAKKEGPYYERWLASMAQRFTEQIGGAPPSADPPGV